VKGECQKSMFVRRQPRQFLAAQISPVNRVVARPGLWPPSSEMPISSNYAEAFSAGRWIIE
jgi:hypothetical protein